MLRIGVLRSSCRRDLRSHSRSAFSQPRPRLDLFSRFTPLHPPPLAVAAGVRLDVVQRLLGDPVAVPYPVEHVLPDSPPFGRHAPRRLVVSSVLLYAPATRLPSSFESCSDPASRCSHAQNPFWISAAPAAPPALRFSPPPLFPPASSYVLFCALPFSAEAPFSSPGFSPG